MPGADVRHADAMERIAAALDKLVAHFMPVMPAPPAPGSELTEAPQPPPAPEPKAE